MRKTLMALLCGALLSITAFAADLTGDWKAEMKTRNGDTREVTFKLKQDGNNLTGTMTGMRGDMQISNGKIDGDNVSFDTKMETPNGEFTINYTGTVSGDELKLKRNMPAGGGNGGGGGRGGSGEMVAKRVKVS